MDNLWIASLPPEDQKRLKPHLNERPIEPGEILYDAGDAVDEVWFPHDGAISLMTILDEDRMVETAAIGREGLVGVTCGPLNARAASRAIAQIQGVASCCPADVFADALARSEAMRHALATFTEGLMAQVQQTAACNAQHPLDERLARWLLTISDRVETHRVVLTQSDIAQMLGVRRATVSEVGSELVDRGLIRRGRGWIEIVDRPRLEQSACGCYRMMRGVLADLGVPQVRRR
ncbi:Crp/Fnr family transcriptional regulator [Brevundimonas lutea]|uniref:Crp/Fnr family transcriptional regulator n=1 Tax=Brevundimonas lutea TaxID=2293980 RepID=UPI000F03CF3C|nr:Crp/Fnr family transcriptional regulator [Brevundimonas lutea]